MTKENWIKHIENASGLTRPSKGGSKVEWQAEVSRHLFRQCPECQDRAKTKKRNASARAREYAYRSCGLKKVIGSVSGQVYWE